MQLPSPRGPLSAAVFGALTGGRDLDLSDCSAAVDSCSRCPLEDEDLQIALWSLYELHYGGFDDVDDAYEWSPPLLMARQCLERPFESTLRDHTRGWVREICDSSGPVPQRLFGFVEGIASPPLARYLQHTATSSQLLEFLIHRSIYQLKEADPHSWAIPRLTGAAKVALVEVQYDEYGAGRPDALHSKMYADTLAACGLRTGYGAYIEAVPAVTLAVNNAMSLFGLHRRLRGAVVGHLAAFEATSSIPARRVSHGLRRLHYPEPAAAYYDEHVEADAVHEQLVIRHICARLIEDDPSALSSVAFGLASCLLLDNRAAEQMLGAWARGASSLRPVELISRAVGA